MTSKVRAEIRLMGDNLDFVEITNQLGVSPTKIWKEGERSGPDRPARQYDCWLFSTGRLETIDVGDVFRRILDIFSAKSADIKNLVQSRKLEVCFDVELIFPPDSPPALYFHRDFLDFLNCIQARVDIDMYCEAPSHSATFGQS